jgi:(p)ppGpp synthase/HD superfamily hydrolase
MNYTSSEIKTQELAKLVATIAHKAQGQKRKYSGSDYIVHPVAVAEIVKSYDGDSDQVCAAYLHDVIEDTHITLEFLGGLFSENIVLMVSWLTSVSIPTDGNRDKRKSIDRKHSSKAPIDAQFVKCADLIHNLRDICEADPNFAKVYVLEKELLLNAMTKVQKSKIWRDTMQIVKDYNGN